MHGTPAQVRVMLCDKAGKPLPPSECRKLRTIMGAWLVTGRHVLLAEPSVRQVPPDAANPCTAPPGASLADVCKMYSVPLDSVCWDVLEELEVVLESGLRQVRVSVGLSDDRKKALQSSFDAH